MIPKFRVFAKAGVEAVFGGGYDRDQMFYEIRDIDFYDEDVTVWGCHRKDCGMCDDTYKMEDVEIMMSTGLKDKNGVEIYDGDIVKIDDYFNGEMKAKVVFEKGSFGFVGIDKKVSDIVNSNWNDDFLSTSYLSWAYDHPDNDLSNVIIIGNIYENTELLEVAE